MATQFERAAAESGLVPLNEEQRKAYPTVIYEEVSNDADSRAILLATLAAASSAGFEMVADLDSNESTGAHTAVIRTAASRPQEHRTEAALIHGAARAINLKLEEMHAAGAEAPSVEEFAPAAAKTIVGQLAPDSKLYEAFADYYGGLRWGSDQEKFAAALLTESTVYDSEAVAANFNGSDVISLIYELELDVPYEVYKGWRKMGLAEVLEEAPMLDYRRLDDENFQKTPLGQILKEGYRRVLGHKLADRYKRYPREITDDGKLTPKPIIPIAQFPVIEALMVDQVSISKPRAKYDFGARDVDELIVKSDSVAAQRALVVSIGTRLPREDRHVYDGPDEFDHKRGDVGSLLRGYMDSYDDDTQRNNFKEYLINILQAYSNNGSIALDVRREWQTRMARTSENIYMPETSGVKRITQDILTIGLASPDAEEFIATHMPDFEKGLAPIEVDPLILSSDEYKLMLLEALDSVSMHSHADVFERIGTKIFQDPTIGAVLREVAKLRIQASRMLNAPEILLARREFGRHMHATDSSEQDKTRARLDELTAPAEALRKQAHDKLNNLYFDYLSKMIDSGELSDEKNETIRMFEAIVKRLNVGDSFYMEQLPDVYKDLIALADRPDLPDRQKSTVLWHFASRFKYSGEKAGKYLTPVIIDIYRVMLGPIGDLRIPTEATDHGLEAANFIARNTPVFKYATQDELLVLHSYKVELALLIQKLSSGILTAEIDIVDENNDELFEGWQEKQISNVADVVRTMSYLEEMYGEYLHLEEVKVKSSVYYPWLMEQLAPFWHKMQWEVGSGQHPRPNVRDLHAVLKEHIDNLLVLQNGDYSEGFDAVGEGHIDSLLLECYERMALDHDIQHNGTVWKEGLTFLRYAADMMPPTLIEQIRQAHPDDPRYTRFLEYIEQHQTRRNTEK